MLVIYFDFVMVSMLFLYVICAVWSFRFHKDKKKSKQKRGIISNLKFLPLQKDLIP